MSRLIPALLTMTGRVTMFGIARWTEKGGSYRTIQRFYLYHDATLGSAVLAVYPTATRINDGYLFVGW